MESRVDDTLLLRRKFGGAIFGEDNEVSESLTVTTQRPGDIGRMVKHAIIESVILEPHTIIRERRCLVDRLSTAMLML